LTEVNRLFDLGQTMPTIFLRAPQTTVKCKIIHRRRRDRSFQPKSLSMSMLRLGWKEYLKCLRGDRGNFLFIASRPPSLWWVDLAAGGHHYAQHHHF
jgi:hypothetical protein